MEQYHCDSMTKSICPTEIKTLVSLQYFYIVK